ncbi:hypothetical protein AZE42_11479 [Rhizopogon vesiculosus]|uniref:Uncharacterized protein n=1 Tax=Rhizopogon vesiculosus TaxID=180088 RepID=A0A1J8RAS1_9AGAM|nr:hypothetical protein AZE42_11479 [Rhizopogon vesiculosus]
MVNQTGSSNDEKMPDWWKPPKHPVLAVLFSFLSLISMARPTLDHHWQSKISDEEWEKHKKMVIERLNNTNITAGLVLTSSAVFVSTTPPLTSFLPYTIRGCYILALGSFAHALGALLCGLAVVNIYEASGRLWAKDVSGKLGTACMAIHAITGVDCHALSTVLYSSIHLLAGCVSHAFYSLFDAISSDRVLCFWGVVASILGDNRDYIMGLAATSLCLVCARKDFTTG